MKRLIIDIDEVIRNTIPKVLDIYNTNINTKSSQKTIDDIVEWDLTKSLPDLRDSFYDSEGFFRHYGEEIFLHSEPVPDSIKYINKLKDEGNYIILASSQFQGMEEYTCKWLGESKLIEDIDPKVYGQVKYDDLIFTHDKGKIRGDAMIDDKFSNFKGFDGMKIMFDRPWNRKYGGVYRKDNWKDIYNLITDKNQLKIDIR